MRGFDTTVRYPDHVLPIEVRYRTGKPKTRTFVRFPGVSTSDFLGVHNYSTPNVLRGLVERVYCVERNGVLVPPPRPKPGVYGERLGPLRNELVGLLRGCQPITTDQFVGGYSGVKHARYARAAKTVERTGPLRQYNEIRAFPKGETIFRDVKPDPAPRVIQPRSTEYNVQLGPFIKPLEGRVYRALAKMCGGGPVVMKGYNADQVGRIVADAWSNFNAPVAHSMDASRFDQHVSPDALELEHSVYHSAYRHLPASQRKLLTYLLRAQVVNVGRSYMPDAIIKYEVNGNRMSGDMNTSLGNCLLMCLMVMAYCRSKNLKFRLINNGDDAVVITEAADGPAFREGLTEWFLDMGFTMQVEPPVATLELVEFCQCQPVNVNGNYRMVRNPFRCIDKDTTWKQPTMAKQGKHANTWLSNVGECGLAIASGVPVVQALYSWMARHPRQHSHAIGFGNKRTGMEHLRQGLCRGASEVSASTRFSFWLAFGITPDVQVQLEQEWDAMPLVDCTRQYDHPHGTGAGQLIRRNIPTYTKHR